MSRKKRKRKEFIVYLGEMGRRDLEFYMENTEIPCQECGTITRVHAYGKGKQVIRYACWNKKCSLYGIEQTMTNCHREIKKHLRR